MDTATFNFIEEVFAPDGVGDHVVDYEVQTILSGGWQRYVAFMREASGDAHTPVVRRITTSFESECRGGVRLLLGVRAAHRSRRSYTLEEALWIAETHMIIATSTAVVVSLDRAIGRAVEVPPPLWSAVERFEGRTIGFEALPR